MHMIPGTYMIYRNYTSSGTVPGFPQRDIRYMQFISFDKSQRSYHVILRTATKTNRERCALFIRTGIAPLMLCYGMALEGR